jgi:xanthine dehydrogenase molybdenum-binding subunit
MENMSDNFQIKNESVRDLLVVGKSFPMLDAYAKVKGEAKYVGDMDLPGMLHGKILRSPYPHARILDIDVSKAKALPGVKAVITYKDVPAVKYNSAERFFGQLAALPATETILAEKARYVGDRIAAVAATSEEIAEKALELISLKYEELPAVFDPEEALEEGAPAIHEGGNLAKHVEMVVGDVEEGFKKSDFVFEGKYRTQIVQHCPLETHACLASYQGGRLTVWVPTHTPFPFRFILARALLLPINKIRIISPLIGGGFGGKNEVVDEVVCAALAIKTGKPVKMVMSREEEFYCSRTRHSSVSYLKTGVKKDGTLVAREMKTILNTGAYASGGPLVLSVLGAHTFSLYRIPHIRFDGYCVYTNLPVAGAMRGYGNPQGTFPGEVQLDEIAEELGMDPVEIRIKNAVRAGDLNPLTGLPLGNVGFIECLKRGAEKIGWYRKRDEYRNKAGRFRRGIGVACGSHNTGTFPSVVPEFSSAIVSVNEDGTVNLLTGVADLGTGSSTTLAQIVAETIGVNLEDVTVVAADTDVTPIDRGVFASRGAYIGGLAAREAAVEARELLLEEASKILGADKRKLAAGQGIIFSTQDPEKKIAIADVVRSALSRKDGPRQIIGKATVHASANPYSYAAQFAELLVDSETGEIKVLKMVAAHDVGRAINPSIVEGQIEGALAMGLGYALKEELIFDDKGRPKNADFGSYELVRADEMPEIEVILIELGEPSGPYGAKGVGEIGLVPTAPAIVNAIYNATGERFREIPVTKGKMLERLRGRKKDSQIL